MNNLSWFSKWYANQVCKNTIECIHVNISTIENSAWRISIDLKQTKYKEISFKNLKKVKSDYNWYSIDIKNKVFFAEGDFTKLDFLVGKFREIIGEGSHRISIKEDYFFNTNIQEFIFEDDNDSLIFLHYTNKKKIAEKILLTGLEFTNAFDKTATKVKNNLIDLSYNHYIRKQFGENVILICISKQLYKFYIDAINKSSSSVLRVEEILGEKPIYFNDESEEVYTLCNKYIKGYFNFKSGEIIKNPDYNPSYDSKIFLKNVKEG